MPVGRNGPGAAWAKTTNSILRKSCKMDCAKLVPMVERLAGVRALVIGDAMLDHYVIGRVERISPEAPVPILQVTGEFNRAGGAANVAANITALGGKAALLALAGRGGALDSDGQALADSCREMKIEVTLLPALPCTVRKARMVAGRQQILRVDWEHPYSAEHKEKFALPPQQQQQRAQMLSPLLAKCDIVLVSDYAKGMVDGELMQQLAACGKPVIVDPRPQNRDFYRGVTLITPNRKEATEMLGAHERLPGEELGRRLGDLLGCDILVTLGEEGMCLCRRGELPLSIPTRAREVFDVTGAGDTVAAAFALALGAGGAMPEAAHLANAAAGVVVGRMGCASVTPAELRQALLSHPEGESDN